MHFCILSFWQKKTNEAFTLELSSYYVLLTPEKKRQYSCHNFSSNIELKLNELEICFQIEFEYLFRGSQWSLESSVNLIRLKTETIIYFDFRLVFIIETALLSIDENS